MVGQKRERGKKKEQMLSAGNLGEKKGGKQGPGLERKRPNA